jgi:hypothetical protein
MPRNAAKCRELRLTCSVFTSTSLLLGRSGRKTAGSASILGGSSGPGSGRHAKENNHMRRPPNSCTKGGRKGGRMINNDHKPLIKIYKYLNSENTFI